MRKLTITLSEDEYDFVKQQPRGWTRTTISHLKWLTEHPDARPIRPWWKFW